MRRLALESWFLLAEVETIMLIRDFKDLHKHVSREPVRRGSAGASIAAETLSRAMDFACVFYFKQVLCLQRSAATTLLLRRHGLPAEMVIGAQLLPFKSPRRDIADVPPTSAAR